MGPLLSGVRLGTHRVAAPEETWQRLVPLLPAVGITRVADVTGLDDIGVPVWQAVRPNSANLSVSQGKGITHELARVSAAMESFELHCAERPQLITRTASPSQLSSQLPYDWADLVLLDHHAMATGRPITWCQSENLLTGTTAWVPTESVVVDMTLRTRWVPPTVKTTSNGLASGNILEEATVHALLELMERHALALAREGAGLWSAAVEIRPGAWGAASAVLRRCRDAGAVVQVADVTGDLQVPAFAARIWSPSVPWWFAGSGAHLDADVALSRAVTEALQSRLTAVAGARDDLPVIRFDPAAEPPGRRARERVTTVDDLLGAYSAVPQTPSPRDLTTDLDHLLRLLSRRGHTVLRADLTNPSYGLPVVRLVVPGLRFDPKA